MPTVIDSLVVTLGLDTKNFDEGQRKSIEQLRKLEEVSRKHVEPTNKGVQNLIGTFKELQGRMLAIGAVIAAGLGFNKLIQDVTRLNNELGKTSVQLGMAAKEISAWEHVGATIGAPAGTMTASLALMRKEIEEIKRFGYNKSNVVAGQVGAELLNKNDTPEQGMMKWARWAEKQKDKQYAAGILKDQVGFSADQTSAIMLGSKELEKRLEFGRKFGPSDEQVKKFQELQKAFADMETVLGKLLLNGLEPFITAMTRILKMLTDWLGKWAENPASVSPWQSDSPAKVEENKKWGWANPFKWGSSKPEAENGGAAGGGDNDNIQRRFGDWKAGPAGGSMPSGGSGSGSGGSVGGGEANGTLAEQRRRFAEELNGNPALREKVMRIAANEQGRNPRGTQMVLESMMNRAIVRGTNLETQARWFKGEHRGYYEMGNMGRGSLENSIHRQILERSLGNTLNGSNISNYATDNSSGGLAARERASGKFRFRESQNGETFFSPGWGEPGLAKKWDQWHKSTVDTEASRAAGGGTSTQGSGDGEEGAWGPQTKTQMKIRTPMPSTSDGAQRSFDAWRNLGLGAGGAINREGDRSSIDNSNTTTTSIGNMNVTVPPGADPSAYADGISRRLADYNNVQNSNTGMV